MNTKTQSNLISSQLIRQNLCDTRV